MRRPAGGSVADVRALVQRVSEASVAVDGAVVDAIGAGMLVLLGVGPSDDEAIADRIAAKLRALRVFEDAEGRMGEPLGAGREALVVSQFTLYADTRKGTRPSFTGAAPPAHAEPLYARVRDALGGKGGRFGARMAVALVNDGPVTVMVEID